MSYEELLGQINSLDNKDSIHYLTVIANGANPPGETDNEYITNLLAHAEDGARLSGVTLPARFAEIAQEKNLDSREGGPIARDLLTALARQPGGEKILHAALKEPGSTTADFGIVSGPLLLTFLWLVTTGEINIKVGQFDYHKSGLRAEQQAALFKGLLPSIAQALFGGHAPKRGDRAS